MSGESGSKNMNWMYEGKDSKVQQEEYLLGKQIDKTFEQEQLGTLGQINAVEYGKKKFGQKFCSKLSLS